MGLIDGIGKALGWLMTLCFSLTKNYGLSIILFTFLTKIILFPVNMLTQKNSINMVKLMPEENALKIKYIDDKDTLTDKRLELYKKYKYNPMLSTIPLLIQIPLVLGLVYVIYRPLSFLLGSDPQVISELTARLTELIGAENITDAHEIEIINYIQNGLMSTEGLLAQDIAGINSLSMTFLGMDLSHTPSFTADRILLLIPLLSGLSAWLLCDVQNRINVLQVTQNKVTIVLTTLFMIAFSTYFAFLVPAGVGLYWIFGNLFAVPFMFLLNVVIPPKKYVDYSYLKKMNEQRIEKERIHKKYLSREKADYKSFFAVEKMQLMFYSEQSGFYKYFSGMIDYICEHSDITIHYVTSDPEDKIFSMDNPQIRPYYIASDKYIIPLFMKLDCDMCIMTMPDLEKYHIKRSRVRKNIEYIYVSHGMGSVALTLRKGALDWYDTVFCPGVDTYNEIRDAEELYNTPKKRLVETGYVLIDEMIEQYDKMPHAKNEIPKILIAPSWQPDNIIDLCLEQVLESLSQTDYEIIVRPHPQQVRHEPEKFDLLKEKFGDKDNITIQTDFSANSPVMEADVLITDWSDICWEFAFCTKRPILFINTPMKVMNPEYDKIKTPPINISLRNEIGKAIEPEEAGKVNEVVGNLLAEREAYREKITEVLNAHLYNLGKSKILSGKYIIKSLTKKI